MKSPVRQLIRLPDRFLFGRSGRTQRLPFGSARQAKQFLIEVIEAQAVRDRITLSDVEQRMLWFSESDRQGPPGADLDDAESLEKKVRGLTVRLVKRLKAESGEQYELWTAARKTLRTGDHYLVVLTDVNDDHDRPPYDRLKLWLTALAIVVISTFGVMWLSRTIRLALTKEESAFVVWAIAAIVVLVAYSIRLVRWIRQKNRVSRKHFED